MTPIERMPLSRMSGGVRGPAVIGDLALLDRDGVHAQQVETGRLQQDC